MNKSDLIVIESIISERYISAPKRAKKTQRGYLRDVIEGTIMGMQKESGTAPTVFKEALKSIKSDPLHSAGYFREALIKASKKYISVVSPLHFPKADNTAESDEAVLKRLGIPVNSVDLQSDSVRILIDAQRKSKKSEFGKREIQAMRDKHIEEHAPLLYPSEIEFYPKGADVKNNTPVKSRGWHWSTLIKYTIAQRWINTLREADLLEFFEFTDEDIQEISEKFEAEALKNEEIRDEAFGETETETK
jgi:hypothetical protein